MSDLTTTSFADAAGSGFTARGRPGNDRVFRRARRHSRLVRTLRVAVPVASLVFVVALAGVMWFDPLRALTKLPASVENVVVSGTKITMAAPKLSGFTRDGRRYDLSARTATQDVTNPDLLEMLDITAKFETQDKTKLDLTAATGVYLRKTNMLTLRRNVVLTTSSGYQVYLDEVQVDTATSNIVSEKPVHIEMLQGTLNANRLEVLKSGDVVTFDGGVKMKLLMNEQQQQQKQIPEKSDKP